MRRAFLLQTLGIGVVGFALTLGCRHSTCDCSCSSRLEPAPAMTMLPVPAPAETPKVVAQPTTITKTEPAVLPSAKPAPPPGDIAVTDIAPPATGSRPGAASGTVVLSAADAETLGIKPGYTPEALILPDLPPHLPEPPASEQKADAEQKKGDAEQKTDSANEQK